jgi:predicted unusual protein kinase regulating ubiquinone biosynthesis (AarF/ABC1/UbiB family)
MDDVAAVAIEEKPASKPKEPALNSTMAEPASKPAELTTKPEEKPASKPKEPASKPEVPTLNSTGKVVQANKNAASSDKVGKVVPTLTGSVDLVKLAQDIAPEVEAMADPAQRKRKRDRVYGAFRTLRNVFTFRKEVKKVTDELIDDSCEIDEEAICADDDAKKKGEKQLSGLIADTFRFASGKASASEMAEGDSMEMGWQTRGKSSSFKRTIEVWKFLAACGLKVVKAKKAKGTDEEISAAKTAAAEFIRDGLFRLGPTFVKLGQVITTRSDILEKEYIEVLRDLQDNVPGFGGDRAVAIIENELGKPIDEIFDSFEKEPIAAASLGQVHRATCKGKSVAVKVQRAGLKALFDTDLKNLKKLAVLLDKLDPKSDGADRSYNDIFDESAKLLYEEIDYTLEGKNAARFKQSFDDIGINYIRVPTVYWEVTNPQVLTMEFIDSFKLTDMDKVEAAGIDKEKVAAQVADSFLAQILKTSYFHCDPHPGNLQCDKDGKLVYFDCGMMNELKPNVANGFKEACLAVFGGGPYISDIQLDVAGKRLVDALEEAGVLAKGADRLSVEKLARYFIRSFKDVQIGKERPNIKQTLGADLQKLTEEQVFRFPSTFTFIFRSFASVDGIGKGLSDTFDIGKSAQPFVEALGEEDRGGGAQTPGEQFISRFGMATGLNVKDIDTAITQPRKVAYLERTIRSMEQGNLKIRVRSLENELALGRLALGQALTNKLLAASLLLNLGLAGATPLPSAVYLAGAALMGAQAGFGALSIKIFDKKASRYESKDFAGTE